MQIKMKLVKFLRVKHYGRDPIIKEHHVYTGSVVGWLKLM